MFQHNSIRIEAYRPDVDATHKITIEINDINSEHIPHVFSQLQPLFQLPDLGKLELPELPSLEDQQLPLLSSSPLQEALNGADKSHRRIESQRNIPRKAGGQ